MQDDQSFPADDVRVEVEHEHVRFVLRGQALEQVAEQFEEVQEKDRHQQGTLTQQLQGKHIDFVSLDVIRDEKDVEDDK